MLAKVLGISVSSEQIEKMISSVDLDGDGKLNMNEFRRKYYHKV